MEKYYLNKDLIKEQLRNKKLKQIYVARQIPIHHIIFSSWVNEWYPVTEKNLIKICRIIKCKPQEIVRVNK